MNKFILIGILLLPIKSFSQSFLLYTTAKNKTLCIKQMENDEIMILDSTCNYTLKDYSIFGDRLECITETGAKKYYSINTISHFLKKKEDFKNLSTVNIVVTFNFKEYELLELDYNISLCSGSQKKWVIVNSKNGRKPHCDSTNSEMNKKLKIFGHPTLSNNGDYFIYNQEKWNWLSSSYKTYEVNMHTGKQERLYNGINTQISPTDQYLLFTDLSNRHFVYDRSKKQKIAIQASSAFWLYLK